MADETHHDRDDERRYRFLFEENPSMYFTVDAAGIVRSVNPFGAKQLGYEVDDLVGLPVLDVFHEDDKSAVRKQFQTCLDQPGRAFDWEFRKIRKDGAVMWVREFARAVTDWTGNAIVLIVCEDITHRKAVEEELRQARDEMELRVRRRTAELEAQRRYLRQVIDVDPNFIFAKDREGRFTLVNQAVADAYGRTVEELIGKSDADFNPNEAEVEFFRRIDAEVIETQQPRSIAEESITDSMGRVRWLQTIKSPLIGADGVADQVLGSATDITARKEAEQALRDGEAELRDLTGRLLTAHEDERRRLARQMHDDISQRLAVLAIQAGQIERKSGISAEELTQMIAKMRAGLQELSTDVHSLSRRLHPAILEDLGLVDALQAECVAFRQREGINVHFEAVQVPGDLSREVAICLYRIVQEGLRNTAKHAATDQAWVSLTGRGDSLVLRIRDPGVGFEISRAQPRTGLGLSSMKERARLIEAELTLESRPAKGTSIEVRVPLGRSREPRGGPGGAAPTEDA